MKQTQEPIPMPTPILLHGTWARGAKWTGQESKLFQALRREIGEPIPVEWRGRNRDADRRSAAQQVISKLEKREGPIFLIAHSHGGNVAVYAAAEACMQKKVAGIICLNTPFISAVRRDYTSRLALLGMMTVLAPILLVAGDLLNSINGTLAEAAIILGTTAAMALSLGAAIPLIRYLHDKGAVIWKRLSPEQVRGVPVLCISAGDDEAQYGLSFLEHISNLPIALLHPLMIAVGYGLALIFQLTGLLPEWHMLGLSPGAIFGSFAYLFLLLAALQLVGFIFSVTSGRIALGLGAGYWPLFYPFFIRVGVTHTPLNYRKTDFVDAVVAVAQKGSWLAHSRIYEDEEVIRHVVSWIRDRHNEHVEAKSKEKS